MRTKVRQEPTTASVVRQSPGLTVREEPDPKQMLKVAMSVCKQHGFNLCDGEIESAINFAVFIATVKWRAGKGRNPCSLAARFAKAACCDVYKKQRFLNRTYKTTGSYEDKYGVDLGEDHPLLTDEEVDLLSFVLKHGRKEAASLLGMTNIALRDLLDEVEHEIQRRNKLESA